MTSTMPTMPTMPTERTERIKHRLQIAWTLGLLYVVSACSTATTANAPFPTTPPLASSSQLTSVVAPPPSALRYELSNGISLVLVEDHRLPTFDFLFHIPGGDRLDPEGQQGLGTLAMKLATEGAGDLDAEAFAARLEGLGASLSASASSERFTYRGSGLPRVMPELLELFTMIWQQPRFDEAEVAKTMNLQLKKLMHKRSVPTYIATRAMIEALFPACTYGFFDLDEAFLEAVDATQLKRHHSDVIAKVPPSGAIFLAVGDFDAPALVERLRGLLGGVPRRETEPGLRPACGEAPPAEVILIDRPGSTQSVITLGGRVPGIHGGDPAAIDLCNEILGGGASRRLFKRLREELGLTYGAYSSVNRYAGAGVWSLSLQTRTEKTGEALRELLGSMEGMRQLPVPDLERQRAVDYVLGSFPRRGASPGSQLGRLSHVVVHELPWDYWSRYLRRYGEVTAEELLADAERWMPRIERSITVIVGDASKVQPQLNLPDGVPLKVIPSTPPNKIPQ